MAMPRCSSAVRVQLGFVDANTPGGAPGGVVLARRPPDEPIRRLDFRERVAPSLWFTPGLFVVGAFVLSKVSVVAD